MSKHIVKHFKKTYTYEKKEKIMITREIDRQLNAACKKLSDESNPRIPLNYMVEELLPLFYVFHKSNYTVESALPNFEIQKKKLKDKALINNFFYKKDFKNILETHSKYEDFYNNHRTHLRELYKIINDDHYAIHYGHH